jgi:hypothetical protein
MKKRITKKILLLIVSFLIIAGGASFLLLNYYKKQKGTGRADVVLKSAQARIEGNQQYVVGQDFFLPVKIDAQGNQICVVEAHLTFPKNLMEILEKPNEGNNLLAFPRDYSNDSGTINYAVGILGENQQTSCTTGVATLFTLHFKAKDQGEGTIVFNSLTALGGTDGETSIPISGENFGIKFTSITQPPDNTNGNNGGVGGDTSGGGTVYGNRNRNYNKNSAPTTTINQNVNTNTNTNLNTNINTNANQNPNANTSPSDWENAPEETPEYLVIKQFHYNAFFIDRFNLNGEYVVLENKGTTIVSTAGWRIKNKKNETFTLPGILLKPRETLTIRSGKESSSFWHKLFYKAEHNTVYMNRKSEMWDNRHDRITIYAGNTIITKGY